MLLPSIALAFCVTLTFMVALRPFAISIGLVDKPGGRKRHIGAVPMIGGLAMFAGIGSGLLLLGGDIKTSVFLLFSGGLLVSVGVLDDKYPLPAGVRLAAQLSAILILYYGAGLRMDSIGDPFGLGVISLGPFSLLFTALVAISVVNAFNLVDGVDGLAGCLGVLALGPIAIIAGYETLAGMVAIVAISALIAFLLFNFPTIRNRRVRTFMGDAGSTLVGLLVVCTTTLVSHGPGAIASPVVCLWFAAMPIFDLFTCFVRRSLRGHSPFKPGRDHFHHVLARSGMGVRKTLGVLTGLQLVFLSIGLIGHFAGIPDTAMFALWAVLGLSTGRVLRRLAALYRLNRRRRRDISAERKTSTRKAA